MKDNPRRYGKAPYRVVLVHGGPGAPGEMKPVAATLSDAYGVLEPLQTQATVRGQVEELRQVIAQVAEAPVVLIGWSWGAWLSFIVAAEYGALVKKLILISSGPFAAHYAEQIMPMRLSHLSEPERLRVQELLAFLEQGEISHKGELFAEFGALMSKADSYRPLPPGDVDDANDVNDGAVQSAIYQSVWAEADELRSSGKLLQFGPRIACPVTVIHGDYDPHPFEGVREPLSGVLKAPKFILLEHCGHHPWAEIEAKEQFYRALRQEIGL